MVSASPSGPHAARSINLAMWLTWSRVLLAPVLAMVFFSPGLTARWVALALVIVSELTDMLDGMAARWQQRVSDFGKLLDPFADSVFRFTVFLCLGVELIRIQPQQLWPIGLILVFFYRDVLVSGVRIICATRGLVVSARFSGKAKAVVQAVAILVVLLLRVRGAEPAWDLLHYTTYAWLLGVAAAVTAWSAWDYVQGNWLVLRQVIRE